MIINFKIFFWFNLHNFVATFYSTKYPKIILFIYWWALEAFNFSGIKFKT